MNDLIATIMSEELAALADPPPTESAATRAPATELRDQLLLARGDAAAARSAMPAFSMDTVVVSPNGGVFLVGWCDDVADPVDVVRVTGAGWRVAFDGAGLARVRRRDVEGALGSSQASAHGFWGFVFGRHPIAAQGICSVEILLRSGATQAIQVELRAVDDAGLRAVILTYLTTSEWIGAGGVEAIACLEPVIGRGLLSLNAAISSQLTRAPHVERFASGRSRPRGSIVVCLYGKPEYLFLQNAAFFATRGMADYELVYVSNSPELAETLLREARNAHLIYGVDHTLVLLGGNAGFGAANNAAVRHCASGRILIVNPDIFPADPEWALRHADVVDNLPPAQTRLFGIPMHYNDGSLMHGGMYFDVDTGLSVTASGIRRRRLARVEHYGKGAPPDTAEFTRARPVPAVTGAFISLDRDWFEHLGGFTEQYVFGHYEDADLCLKSLRAGTPAWLHDIRMWHLEGKGSTRLPVHEGGSTVNRWLFSETWLPDIDAGLTGPVPTHPAFSSSNHLAPSLAVDAGVADASWKRTRRVRAVRAGA